jgi:hypothetical protein
VIVYLLTGLAVLTAWIGLAVAVGLVVGGAVHLRDEQAPRDRVHW